MRINLFRSVFASVLAATVLAAAPAAAQGPASSYCTISFNANGGRGTMANQTVTPGVEFTLRKNAFTRSGYVFVGWAQSSSGPVVVGDRGTGIAGSAGSITLYAKWKKNNQGGNYKVRFAANGGRGKMAVQTIARNKAVALRKNAFRRKGCVFAGWATKKNGAVAYSDGAKVKNIAAKGKTVTLYAKWAKKTYKVAFDPNGGKRKMGAQKMTYGKAAKLKANKFTAPKGYVFKGWAKSKKNAKKGKVAYKNKQSVKNLSSKGGTVKLYAVWGKKPKDSGTVTFVFHVNGPVKSVPNLTVSKYNHGVDYGTHLRRYDFETQYSVPDGKGSVVWYHFDSWVWRDGPGGKDNSSNHFWSGLNATYFYDLGFRKVHLWAKWTGPWGNSLY